MKLKTLKCTLFLSTLCISGLSSAQKFDESRAIALSNAMIQLFANSHLSNPDDQIKVLALMEGISEAETRKNNQQMIQEYQSPSASMFTTLKNQFGEQDFKIIQPALQHQLITQNSFYQSCKISGKVIKQQDDLLIPLNCQVPTINLSTITPPQRQKNDSEAQFMARSISTITHALESSPKQTLSTQILIHRIDHQRYIPEMDNQNYFPSSITQHIVGSTEEESVIWEGEEDAAP